MEFDIEKMCRVCLKTDVESVLLFESPKKVGGVSISEMISELTIYKVYRHDEFPHLICYECMERVENAYSFKKDFEQAHRKLISYLDSINKYEAIRDIKPKPTEEKCTQTIDSSLYPCEKCDQKFVKYERLREHRAIAHKGSANMCRVCHKSFNRLAGLKSHISAAHPEIGYHNSSNQCYVCNKMFTRRDHVTRHIKNVHKLEATSILGLDLGTSRSEPEYDDTSNQLLEEDESKADDASKPSIRSLIECLVCNKHFSGPTRLNRHMQAVHQLDATSILKQERNDEGDSLGHKMEFLDEPNANVDDEEGYDNEDDCDGAGLNTSDDEEDDDDDDEEETDDDNPDNNEDNNSVTAGALKDTEFVAANALVKCETDVVQDQIEKPPIAIKEEKHDYTPTEIIYKPPKQEPRVRTETNLNCYHKLPNGQFGCNMCEKVFKSAYHVRRHYLSHTQEKAFQCNECDMRFSRSDHLKNHMTKHNPIKPFQCEYCTSSYGRADHLKRHREVHHSNDPNVTAPIKGEVCEFCNKSYSSKSYLQKHVLKHTKKSWKCKPCQLVFETNEKLKEHAKTHSKDKPFLCSECGLCFPRKNYLIIHMRRHNGERPYKCQYCDKGFPRSTDLKAHEKCHTGEKTHFCNVCGKGFPRPYKLAVHMRIHTGEKPYQCMHCPKAFAQCNDLKAHIRRHTGERFRCEVCGAGFIQKYNLTQHKADAHGIISESRLGRVTKIPIAAVVPEVVMTEGSDTKVAELQMSLSQNFAFRGVAMH